VQLLLALVLGALFREMAPRLGQKSNRNHSGDVVSARAALALTLAEKVDTVKG
jgi:hypothetical protein